MTPEEYLATLPCSHALSSRWICWNCARRILIKAINDANKFRLDEVFAILESDEGKPYGTPVFRGTRFSAAQFLAELADNDVVKEISRDFLVDDEQLRKFLHALIVLFDAHNQISNDSSINQEK